MWHLFRNVGDIMCSNNLARGMYPYTRTRSSFRSCLSMSSETSFVVVQLELCLMRSTICPRLGSIPRSCRANQSATDDENSDFGNILDFSGVLAGLISGANKTYLNSPSRTSSKPTHNDLVGTGWSAARRAYYLPPYSPNSYKLCRKGSSGYMNTIES